MINTCIKCGEYEVEREIEHELESSFAVCSHCQFKQPFQAMPLYVVTGASGTGKTTVALELTRFQTDYVVLDQDILWSDQFDSPEDNYEQFRNTWLRLIKNISQGGRPVILFGSAIPEQFENLAERRYFSSINYLALVCDEQTLVLRLEKRPSWRKSATAENLDKMKKFNAWFKENSANSDPAIQLFDTSNTSVASTVIAILNWVKTEKIND